VKRGKIMAVNARELPASRMRRRVAHGLLGIALVASTSWAWLSHSRVTELEVHRQVATGRIPGLERIADGVAAECGIPRFSDERSLERFPVKVGLHPTRREAECAAKVSAARSNLIETYLELERLKPLRGKAEAAAAPSIPVALSVAAGAAVWLWASELRHRRKRS
jgi:hypothetical protein